MPKLVLRSATAIIDAGTAEIKYGYPNEEKPQVISPIVGRHSKDISKYYVGKELQERKDFIALTPIVKRRIVDWGAMEKLWSFTINELLGIKSGKDQSIILSESDFAASADRGKTLEIMFEKFGFDAVHVAKSSELAMAAAEQLTGLVIDAGEELTQVVPVRFGRAMTDKLQTLAIGGKDITLLVEKALKEQNTAPVGGITFEMAKRIKEQHCTVAIDYRKEAKKTSFWKSVSKTTIYLPDNSKFKFKTDDLFRCPETLFQPALVNMREEKGLPEMVMAALMGFEKDVRNSMHETIVLAGGSSQFKGIKERLNRELLARQSKHEYTKARFPSLRTPYAKYAAWTGAALLAKHMDPGKLFMVKQDFLEYGRATG